MREEVVKEVERETGTSYTSEAQLGRDKARRAETLRKRLVDSFVSLHLVHGEGERRGSCEGRKRADSTIRPGSVKGKGRSRTLSTPLLLGAGTRAEEKPFFVSRPQLSTMHPSFDVDEEDFLVDEPGEWKGMREGRVLVRVWTREGKDGKGKQKEGDWGMLVEWDVDLSGLVSLGREVSSILSPLRRKLTSSFDSHLPSLRYRPTLSSSASTTSTLPPLFLHATSAVPAIRARTKGTSPTPVHQDRSLITPLRSGRSGNWSRRVRRGEGGRRRSRRA